MPQISLLFITNDYHISWGKKIKNLGENEQRTKGEGMGATSAIDKQIGEIDVKRESRTSSK